MEDKKTGRLVWMDLTVDDANRVSQFYSKVIGWGIQGLSMGEYEDYCMNDPKTGETIAGVCHARGVNDYIPPQWLIYITVEDLDRSLAAAEELGGKVIGDKRSDGKGGHICLVQDPGGAYMMIAG